MAFWKNPFKSEKNELTKYQNKKLGEQGAISISSDDLKRMSEDTIIKADKRETDPHIKGLRRLTRDEADAQVSLVRKPGVKMVTVGGVQLPQENLVQHCLVTGQNGSGKTTLLKQMMVSVLSQIGEGSDQRAIIHDPKGEFVPFVYGLVSKKVPVIILNPLDSRCVAWDIGADITNRAQATTVAGIFVPEPPSSNGNGEFFRKGARILLRNGMDFFILKNLELVENGKDPIEWTFRDLCLVLRDEKTMREVFSRYEETEEAIDFLDRVNNDVPTTVKTYISDLGLIAAAWQGKEKFSLKEFRDTTDGMILILGSHREADAPIQALNTVIIQRASQILLTDSETLSEEKTRQSWLFLDEFTSLGKINNFEKLLQEGRSKGVCNVLSFQNMGVAHTIYTKEIAEAIASECATKFFLKCEGAQAAWVEEYLGEREVWRKEDSRGTNQSIGVNTGKTKSTGKNVGGSVTGFIHTDNWGNSTQDGTSEGVTVTKGSHEGESWRINVEPVVSNGELKMLPKAGKENGVAGFFTTSDVQGVWDYHAAPEELSHAVTITSNEPKFKSRENETRYQYLKSWTPTERDRFGLPKVAPKPTAQAGNDLLGHFYKVQEEHKNGRDI